jgi:enoyl-CoA hydratase
MSDGADRNVGTTVELELREGTAWITIDGPRTRNALTAEAASGLIAACNEIDGDPRVGVAVVRGANGTFCSGASRADLAALAHATSHDAYEVLSHLYGAFRRIGQLAVPSIACVEGAAVGAGMNLALATDLRVATADATLVSGFAPLGIHPGGGHLHLLNRTAGRQTAAALGLFGAKLSGADAERVGLVWSVVPADGIEDAIDALTGHLAGDPALARALKQSLALSTGGEGWDNCLEAERARQLWSLTRPRPSTMQ